MQSFDSALDTKTDSATGAGTSTSTNTSTSTSTSSIARPFQTLNSSLKRIRLDECEHDSISSRSDSMEKEWGVLDLAELDDKELDTKDSPLNRKRSQKEDGKKTGDNLQKGDMDDMDDMDDFAPSGITANPKIVTVDERPILTEKTLSDCNASSFSSTAATTSISLTNQLSKTHLSKPFKPPKPSRSLSGMEDVFTHAQVRTWSEVRIKTWEHRRTNTEGFYYRFVDPTEGQQNGPWSKQSTGEFMVRLQEWKDRGIRIGTSWGIFSMRVSHKAGYQCSSYYRKLLENKALMDPSYAWENGKLIMVSKSSGGEMAMSGLSERWETDEVKEIEANVNRWIKEYHSNMAGRPTASKAKRVESSGSGPAAKSISFGPRNSSIHFRPTIEAPRVKATTASAAPRALSIRLGKQPIDESEMIPAADINDKLAEYSSFMKKSTSVSSEPQAIRQTISLTVAGTMSSLSTMPPARAIVPIEVRKAPLTTLGVKGQTGLSLFWKNIRPVRVECPDVPRYIIPKDVEQRPTWAHRIQPFVQTKVSSVEGCIYKEVQKMHKFDWSSLSEGFEEPVADFQGVLADPPWNFIVEDGRNDGACQLTTLEFADIMESALEMMPNGIVSVWTHKAILPEVVSIMHGLGCRYVENLVWYKMALNNTNLDRASPYFRTSKEILLMFKKGEGFDIRHQRTADVIMDFEKPTSAWIHEEYTEPKPEGVFDMMEILLPDARYIPEAGRGRLLELWAKKSQERRPGWFSIHETKQDSLTAAVATEVEACPALEIKSDADKNSSAAIKATANTDSSLATALEIEAGTDSDSIDEAILEEIANGMDLDE